MPMNYSQTLSEPKNEFHSRIDQFFTYADVETRQHPWQIHANLDILKNKDRTSSILRKYFALNFFLKMLESHGKRVTVRMQSF